MILTLGQLIVVFVLLFCCQAEPETLMTEILHRLRLFVVIILTGTKSDLWRQIIFKYALFPGNV